MKRKADNEYDELKRFLCFFTERFMQIDNLPAEHRPIAMIEALESKNKTMALRGVRQAVNDCIEMARHWETQKVETIDEELITHDTVTLSELRRRFSKDYVKISRRGKINNETEYYLIKSMLNDASSGATSEERQSLQEMIFDYEQKGRIH